MTTLTGKKRLCHSFYSVSVYSRGFLLKERIYSNKALRQITTLPGEGGRLCLSFYGVSVYGRGVLLHEILYSYKALRQITTLPGGEENLSLVIPFVCVW